MSPRYSRAASAVDTRTDLTDRDERTLRRLFGRVYSRGELHVVDELVASDYLGYCSGDGVTYVGPSGVKRHVTRLRAAFYGLDFDIGEVRGSQDGIVVRWTATGRLERPIMGVQPTCRTGRAGEEPGGPAVRVTGCTSVKVADGVVRETYMDWNLDELRDQVAPGRRRRTAEAAREGAPRWGPSR